MEALVDTISAFPDHEAAIRRLWADEDFAELCEHFRWMSEAAKHPHEKRRLQEYRRQRDMLKAEIEAALLAQAKA